MTNTPKDVIAQAEKEFEDFYWERNQYEKRELGIEQYKKFLSSHTKDLLQSVESEIADKIKHKYNGYGGTLGFTQSELLEFSSLSDIISKLK